MNFTLKQIKRKKKKLTCILVRIQSNGLVRKLAEKLLRGPHKHWTAKVGMSLGKISLKWPLAKNQIFDTFTKKDLVY